GASLGYGFAGTTGFVDLAAALTDQAATPVGLVIGLVFLVAGLAFKVSAAPFHMWTPDVYEGAPTPVTAFFSAAPKVAAVALFVRVMLTAFAPVASDWQQIVTFLAVLSMALGAFAAIGQTNIKRLMAYSSIGHVGYALVGLAAGTQTGVIGVVASVVGAYYYLRIIKLMFFDEPVASFQPMPAELRLVLGVSGAFIFFYIFVAGPIGDAAETAARALF